MGMATKGAQQKTQKNQQVMNMTEEQARAHIEAIRWPNGPACVHCGSVNVYRMEGKTTRAGLLACRDCRQHFTCTVGTVMEDSHLPLATWVRAFHLMATSKKGMSALQLQRNLGLGSYRTAWHLAHRIRLAMKCEPVAGLLLKGSVQCDETYVGADRTNIHHVRKGEKPRKRGRGTDKTAVFALVETDGRVRSMPIANIKGETLRAEMVKHIDASAIIVTDELASYPKAAVGFSGHERVKHRAEEYVNAGGFHTNTAESYFALLKRGIRGSFHHVSPKHLHRYCSEFSFRWDGRKMEDAERRDKAIAGVEGKRLLYKQPMAG
jgi:transposase-like protein